jgi:hypothetical protein
VAALLLMQTSWAAQSPSEHQVKAVFLFNFGQFVEWPSRAFETPGAPFGICVIGEDPVGEILDDVVRGELIGARPLIVKRLKDLDNITACNILFIGRGESRHLAGALAAVRGRNVLTVTDIDGAERQGAIIVLFNEKNRIRMRINLAAARASQLVISSKLLRPAEVIGARGN